MNTLITFLIIVLVLVIIYFILRYLQFKKSLPQPEEEQTPIKDSPWWLLPFSNSLARKRIKQIHHHHSHKVHEQQLAEVFIKFSKEPKTTVITPTHFHRLKALVHTHERRHQHKPGFQNLDHLVQKLDEWEQNKPLSSKEKAAIIQELRKIAKKP